MSKFQLVGTRVFQGKILQRVEKKSAMWTGSSYISGYIQETENDSSYNHGKTCHFVLEIYSFAKNTKQQMPNKKRKSMKKTKTEDHCNFSNKRKPMADAVEMGFLLKLTLKFRRRPHFSRTFAPPLPSPASFLHPP